MPQEPSDFTENDWLATLYVLGELPASESAAFESRLESEPDLCSALAQAVRCQSGLQLALAQSTPVTKQVATSRRSLPSSWVVSTAAALLVAVGGLLWHQSSTSVETGSAVQLVSLWQRQADPLEAAAEFEDDEADSTNPDAVPEWLFAAVAMAPLPALIEDPDQVQEN